jgi:putative phosphoesterase
MKVALLSDIHANHYALEAVLNAVRRNNIKVLLITGDFIGYYFWPREVFNLLEKWNVVAVLGNHDNMLVRAKRDKIFLEKMTRKYGSGLSIALDSLDDERLEWLMSLPETAEYKIKDKKILLCHGSPWKNEEYIYPDLVQSSLDRYSNLDVDYVLQGHTHYPMIKSIDGTTVINPGSVGQPRNGKPGAHWALLDVCINHVQHFCEQYDASDVIKESKERHPEIPYLSDILQRI